MSKNTYRGKQEVLRDVLEGMKAPSAKTHIMYKARLSYVQLIQYLNLVKKLELAVYDKKTNKYSLTEKGTAQLLRLKDIPSVNL